MSPLFTICRAADSPIRLSVEAKPMLLIIPYPGFGSLPHFGFTPSPSTLGPFDQGQGAILTDAPRQIGKKPERSR